MPVVPMASEAWDVARSVVREGGLVAFPTDTVYGVACDPYNVLAIEKLYAAKGRDREKAIPLLLADPARLDMVASEIPEAALKLGAKLWPGALTLVVPRREDLPAELGGGESIAVRVPDFQPLQEFLASCGGFLATTSANLSGRPDALTAQQVAEYLGDSVSVIIDGGNSGGAVPSTVVDCRSDPPAVLREGAIPASQISRVLESEQ
jgi:L-threonylcarbamoyladenylate synthase